MSLSQAEINIRNRLLNRNKRHYIIPERELPIIQSIIKEGSVSKKTVCKYYGITYDSLKSQIQNHRSQFKHH